MNISPEILLQTGRKGAQNASKALTILLNKSVRVEISDVKTLPVEEIMDMIKTSDENQIISFAQVLTGTSGAAIMVLSRDDALNLIDVLMGRKVGETKVFQEIDRSAVKETLNILSNSHVTSLSGDLGISIGVNVPKLITLKTITQVIGYLRTEGGKQYKTIVFETRLSVEEFQCKVNLFIIFGFGFINLIENK